MSRRVKITAAVLVIAVVAAIYALSSDKLSFQDLRLDANPQQLQVLADRDTIAVGTTSQEGLLGYVGLVVVVDTPPAGTRPTLSSVSTIREFRPPPDQVRVQPLNKILFEGKVSKSLGAGGTYTAFAANLGLKQAADVLVTDEIHFGYKDRTLIPYAKLRKLKMLPGKSYYFIESATLTSTTHKIYDELQSDGTISDTAFKANGKVYVSRSGFIYNATLGLDLFDVGLVQSDEGGAEPGIAELLAKPRLSPDEAAKLVAELKRASRKAATADLGGIDLPSN